MKHETCILLDLEEANKMIQTVCCITTFWKILKKRRKCQLGFNLNEMKNYLVSDAVNSKPKFDTTQSDLFTENQAWGKYSSLISWIYGMNTEIFTLFAFVKYNLRIETEWTQLVLSSATHCAYGTGTQKETQPAFSDITYKTEKTSFMMRKWFISLYTNMQMRWYFPLTEHMSHAWETIRLFCTEKTARSDFFLIIYKIVNWASFSGTIAASQVFFLYHL